MQKPWPSFTTGAERTVVDVPELLRCFHFYTLSDTNPSFWSLVEMMCFLISHLLPYLPSSPKPWGFICLDLPCSRDFTALSLGRATLRRLEKLAECVQLCTNHTYCPPQWLPGTSVPTEQGEHSWLCLSHSLTNMFRLSSVKGVEEHCPFSQNS